MGRSDAAAPAGTSLSAVLATGVFRERAARRPDYVAERHALLDIVSALATSPEGVLQRLVDATLTLCEADSAGLSILRDGTSGVKEFYWPAIAGVWAPHVGGTTPRDFSPCGVVLDRGTPQLFCRPEKYYGYLAAAVPSIAEALLAPFHVDGAAVGTLWVIHHRDVDHFDLEDERRLRSAARCAAGVYEMLSALDKAGAATTVMASIGGDLHRLGESLKSGTTGCEPAWALSRREKEVVTLVAQGHTNKAVAEKLGVNVKTVETYRARANDKLGFRNRADLVAFALSEGWLQGA